MLWVGTYAAKGGGGLHPLSWSAAGLTVHPPEPRIANASYGACSQTAPLAYFVDEQEEGRVTAWAWENAAWQERASIASGGSLPCYLALHPDGTRLAVANYDDGTVALISLDQESGRSCGFIGVRRQQGQGPDPERQDGPHAHCAVFDGNDWLYHVDLGLDRVFRYRCDGASLGDAEPAFAAPAGSGPRHLAFHPDGRHALLLCELSAELMLLERTQAGFTCRQTIATAPEPSPENLGGHLAIAADGRVFVTNRGHDSLVAFTLTDGVLQRSGWAHTGGKSPRHFHIHAAHVFVAHEESGTLALLSLPARADDAQALVASVSLPGAAFVLEVPWGKAPEPPEDAPHPPSPTPHPGD